MSASWRDLELMAEAVSALPTELPPLVCVTVPCSDFGGSSWMPPAGAVDALTKRRAARAEALERESGGEG